MTSQSCQPGFRLANQQEVIDLLRALPDAPEEKSLQTCSICKIDTPVLIDGYCPVCAEGVFFLSLHS